MLGRKERETVHPTYQACSYKRYLQNFNEALFDPNAISLTSCAYLHNYIQDRNHEPLLDDIYQKYINEAPIYFQFDDLNLEKHIQALASEGNGDKIADAIEHGKFKPSKKLVDTVSSLLAGNEEFVLLAGGSCRMMSYY